MKTLNKYIDTDWKTLAALGVVIGGWIWYIYVAFTL